MLTERAIARVLVDDKLEATERVARVLAMCLAALPNETGVGTSDTAGDNATATIEWSNGEPDVIKALLRNQLLVDNTDQQLAILDSLLALAPPMDEERLRTFVNRRSTLALLKRCVTYFNDLYAGDADEPLRADFVDESDVMYPPAQRGTGNPCLVFTKTTLFHNGPPLQQTLPTESNETETET